MRVGVDNNRLPAAAHLRLRRAIAADDRERPMADVPHLGKKIPRSDADV